MNAATSVDRRGAPEHFLVELTRWLARVAQYSASHPACAKLGESVHAALSRAHAVTS